MVQLLQEVNSNLKEIKGFCKSTSLFNSVVAVYKAEKTFVVKISLTPIGVSVEFAALHPYPVGYLFTSQSPKELEENIKGSAKTISDFVEFIIETCA